MTVFRVNDIVKYKRGLETSFGSVLSVSPKKLRICNFDDCSINIINRECAEVLPKIKLNENEYKKLARYETTITDVAKNNVLENIVNKDNYQITIEDLLCVLEKIDSQNIEPDVFLDEWFCYFNEIIENIIYENQDNTFYNRNTVTAKIHCKLTFWIFDFFDLDINLLVKDIRDYLKNENKQLKNRNFPKDSKILLLRSLNEKNALNNATEDEVHLYIQFAQELCKEDDIDALLAIAYGSYGGNRAFPCDWKRSEKYMLKLFELVDKIPDKAFFANSLGYIYYYGRTTDGVPDYEKAYKYFSFAAFNHIYEAEYKIADMYFNGYGVPKSPQTARGIVDKLYDENLEYIQKGEFDSKFADIAFRMGNYCKNKEDIYDSNFDCMLEYYYQARFAIRMRIQEKNYYGDSNVAVAIENALSETKKLIDFKVENKAKFYSLNGIFHNYFKNGKKIDLKIKKVSTGKYKFIFTAHKIFRQAYSEKLFITIPQLDMCGFYDSLTVNVVSHNDLFSIYSNKAFTIDSMDYEKYYFDGFPEIILDDCEFEIKKPKQNDQIYRFISVQFEPYGKSYDYLCDNEKIKVGDKVTVLVNKEKKELTVINSFEKYEYETALPIKAYKKIQ